jgi:hypothetical protein
MNEHYRDTRKIDPTRGATLADGSSNAQLSAQALGRCGQRARIRWYPNV